ncbi:predicted GPI-anchored protein 58 [Drosophila navojoa]|nr:predicted GPI-anchored protein 58 [Drosophila navojoa]
MKLLAAVLFACVATLALLHSVYGTPVQPAIPEASAANSKPGANPAPNSAPNSAPNAAPNPVPNPKAPAPNSAPNQTALVLNDELSSTPAETQDPLYRVTLQDDNVKDGGPVAVKSLGPSNSNSPGNAAYQGEAAPSLDAAPNMDEISADGAADQQAIVV